MVIGTNIIVQDMGIDIICPKCGAVNPKTKGVDSNRSRCKNIIGYKRNWLLKSNPIFCNSVNYIDIPRDLMWRRERL